MEDEIDLVNEWITGQWLIETSGDSRTVSRYPGKARSQTRWPEHASAQVDKNRGPAKKTLEWSKLQNLHAITERSDHGEEILGRAFGSGVGLPGSRRTRELLVAVGIISV
jgi:hypothetical protein